MTETEQDGMSKVFQALERASQPPLTPADSAAPVVHAVSPGQGASEFIRLLYAVRALKIGDRACVVQILACMPQDGTSTVATGLARAAAAEHGQPVLLVDCAPTGTDRPTLIGSFRQWGTIDAALPPAIGKDRLHMAHFAESCHPLLDIGTSEMQRVLDLARARYSFVVLDCPAATHVPNSAALSRFCDGTLLVVRAETTSRAAIMRTTEEIGRLGGCVLGLVFNRQRDHLPAWLARSL